MNLKYQTGDFLIEAMIGILITALVSLGMLFISSRVLQTQEEMVRQETIVAVLGEKLRNHYLDNPAFNQCAAGANHTFELPSRGQVTYQVRNCTPRTVNYSLGGQTYTVNLPLIDMTVDVPDVGAYTLGAG
jgi:Tfp pilus assembly protein PilV